MLSILAVGGHVPWQTVLAAYGLTQLAAVLPLTPGGIGVIEGTLSLLLIASHVPAPTAVAAVILYRLISFWLLLPLGWASVAALLALQRRGERSVAVGRWADGNPRGGEARLRLGDGVMAVMEDRGAEDGIGAGLHRVGEVGELPGSA